MLQAFKCFIVKNGLICLIDSDYAKRMAISDLKSDDICASLVDNGVAIVIKNDFIIPIPEDMIDYVVDNPDIVLYSFDPANYIEKPIITINVSRDAMIEVKGMYNYAKSAKNMTR